MSSDAHSGGDSMRHPLSDVPKECYDVLRHPRRLRLLHLLGTATHSRSVSDLATELALQEDADRRSVEISLVHTHLPMLSDHDVIERDGDEVVLLDDAAVPSDEFVALVESHAASDRLLETIVHPDRMAILTVLEDATACTLETLASELAAHDGSVVSDVSEANVALHHSHLPAMDDVGVLEYDSASRIVTTDRWAPLLE